MRKHGRVDPCVFEQLPEGRAFALRDDDAARQWDDPRAERETASRRSNLINRLVRLCRERVPV